MRRLSPPASTSNVASISISLAVKAIDFHVHLPTPDWLDISMRGYVEAAESYFRSKVARKTIDELAHEYDGLDIVAVLLAWDAETATGRPRVPNDLVAEACNAYPKTFIGFGSVVRRPEDHRRSFRLSVATRAAGDGMAQDQHLHRHLGLGAALHPN